MTIDVPTTETALADVSEGQLVVQRGDAPARKIRYENLTGQQKVAIVLAQLREETSSTLLKAVGDEEAVPLATEIANLPPLDREVVSRVLEEFVGKVNTTRSIGQGGLAQARRMLAGGHGRGTRRPGRCRTCRAMSPPVPSPRSPRRTRATSCLCSSTSIPRPSP